MKTPSLFLGLPVDRALENQLQKNNQIASLFINESDEQMLKLYLVENLQYLGKWLGESLTEEKLTNVSANIISLLQKISTDYPFRQENLVLLATDPSDKNCYTQ